MVTSVTIMTMTTSLKKTVPAGEFKAKFLALLDEVELKNRRFVVTKRGRPVAQVIPLPAKKSSSLHGTLLYEEDLLAPINAFWDAAR
jgi:prevent-host-death family protein